MLGKKEKIRVLVFPAGEMNSAEICFALSKQVNIELYGASSVERMGRHLFERYRGGLPLIDDAGFLDAFRKLIDEWGIDVVIPTHDTVVDFFSRNRTQFPARLLVPSERTALACRDKSIAMDLFNGADFVPTLFKNAEELPDGAFFVKPRRGQGAVGARKMCSHSTAVSEIDWNNDLVSEFLPGSELTVDCFTDRHGRLLGVFPRYRDRTLGGISVAGSTLGSSPEIQAIADHINHALEFVGLWFFQVKKDALGKWKLLEISARCSGGQCLTRARGVNLPLLSVYALMGEDVTIIENNVQLTMDRLLVPMFNFDYSIKSLYVDYDDTLVDENGVNPEIASLVYQFKRDKVEVNLITRHHASILDSLAHHHLSASVFDSIIHIRHGEPKSNFIHPNGAVFVDNSFSERQQVHVSLGIPVFDVDGAMVLRRWK